ncbi:MAG: hypothetical protein AAFY84_18455, partial [Pseudomonadota bacterium]
MHPSPYLSFSHGVRQIQEAPSEAPGQPLDAVSDVADTTSEAAISFLQWISSGQREALIALAVAFGSAALFYGARIGLMMFLPKLPRRDQYSLSAIVRRMVGRIRSYFIFAASLLIAGQF